MTAITDGLFVLDSDWRFTFLNAPAEQWWRAHEEKPGQANLAGANAWETFPETVGSDLYEACHHASRAQTPGKLELYAASRKQWLMLRLYPFPDGLCVYFVDVSDYKQLEHELLGALQEIASETLWFNHSLTDKLAQTAAKTRRAAAKAAAPPLTRREKQVLEHIARGHDDRYIAAALGLVEQTVRNYITRLYAKLGVHSRAEAVVWARERGLGRTE